MAKISLDKLSGKALRELRNEIDTILPSVEAAEKAALVEKFKALAADADLTLEDIIGGKPARKARAKYRNPSNPSQTWSGHGRRPQWYIDHFEAPTK